MCKVFASSVTRCVPGTTFWTFPLSKPKTMSCRTDLTQCLAHLDWHQSIEEAEFITIKKAMEEIRRPNSVDQVDAFKILGADETKMDPMDLHNHITDHSPSLKTLLSPTLSTRRVNRLWGRSSHILNIFVTYPWI